MNDRPFQVGDRVSSTVEIFDSVHKGDLGTIVCVIGSEHVVPVYGVSWDHTNPRFHSCGGYCEHGTGFFVREERIALHHAPATIDQACFLDLLRGETYV